MIRAIGYAGICLGLPGKSISRTVRLVNASQERLRALTAANLSDLSEILRYNTENKFGLFRFNQSIIPLASHPINRLQWWSDSEFGPQLREIGNFIETKGLRVSMHPGQYTVINSENERVMNASLAELSFTCKVLDSMGVNTSNKIVIHAGSKNPDPVSALNRLESRWALIPAHIRERLVLENDEKNFGVEDLLPLCHRLNIPLVFDRLHHLALPDSRRGRPTENIMAEVVQTWQAKDGLPKVHFSSQEPGKRPGAHSYWLDNNDFVAFADEMANFSIDMMAECKGKDLALIRLREELSSKWGTLIQDG